MRKFLLNFNLILFLSIISGQNAVAEVLEKDKLGSVPKGFTSRNPATDLLAQDNVTRVTGVEVIQTESGLELVLETVTGSKRLVPLIIPDGNDLMIEILDATLAFSIRNGVTEINPTPEVDRVTIDKIDDNSIQVRIVGRDRPLDAEVVSGGDNLVLRVTPEGATTEQEIEEEIEVIATGQSADDDYNVSNATTGTRIDTEIRDIPQSIQVVPQEILESQQTIRLDEALRNVSGVTFGGVDIGRGLRFNIRGFDDAPVLRNGFRQVGIRQSFPETANLERVEVLKGPASVLFGEIEPGGVINLVTKRPLSEPFYKLQAQFGNRGLIRPSVDLSGPLTSDGKLLYRLNTVYQNSDEIQDYDNDIDRFFISPVVSWQIGNRTDLTLELEYLNDERPASFGIPAFGDEIADIPLEQISNEPDDVIEQEYFNVGYDLEHRFSDRWKLRNGFRYTNEDTLLEIAFPNSLDEEGVFSRFWSQQASDNEVFSLQTNVVGEFATGSIEHQLLFGIDLNRTNEDDSSRGDLSNPLPLNIFAPVYEAFPRPDDFGEFPLALDVDTETDRLGVYLQDQISFSDNLILLAGFRYDTIEQRRTGEPTFFAPEGTDETQNDDGFVPRIGIVYQPIEEISLYTSYSQSFTPNTDASVEGDFFDPEEGEGFEVGVKTELLNSKLTATLAYFDISKQNVVTEDPDVLGASIATGEQQSRGVELDAVGEILPGWNIIASYAYIDAEVSENNTIDVGNRLNGVPEHSANLWTTYQLQQGNLEGLGFGLGFDFVGERQGDLENTFKLDNYFLTNAAIFYERNNWRTAVNFRNLFDVEYIAGATATRERSNDTGEPFTMVGSFSVEF